MGHKFTPDDDKAMADIFQRVSYDQPAGVDLSKADDSSDIDLTDPDNGLEVLLDEASQMEPASPEFTAKIEHTQRVLAAIRAERDDPRLESLATMLDQMLAVDWTPPDVMDEEAVDLEVDEDDPLLVAAAGSCLPCQDRANFRAEEVDVTASGKWAGVIGLEGTPTGDGRIINPGALRWDTPIPLRFVSSDVGAHDGAETVGRITRIERLHGGRIWASGDFDMESLVGREAHRQVRENLTNGVSMDLDDVSFEVRVTESRADQVVLNTGVSEDGYVVVDAGTPGDEMNVTTDGRIRAATMVAIPAFSDARISLAASAHIDDTSFNWVDDVGGLPSYIKRISKHLREKGMTEGHAIATAVNVVKKMCATGDINFPGKQEVNAGSRAEACAAVADWERKKAQAKATAGHTQGFAFNPKQWRVPRGNGRLSGRWIDMPDGVLDMISGLKNGEGWGDWSNDSKGRLMAAEEALGDARKINDIADPQYRTYVDEAHGELSRVIDNGDGYGDDLEVVMESRDALGAYLEVKDWSGVDLLEAGDDDAVIRGDVPEGDDTLLDSDDKGRDLMSTEGGKEVGGKEYRKDYNRGWGAGLRGSSSALDNADIRREDDGWYDGYYDAAAGRPKRSAEEYRKVGVAPGDDDAYFKAIKTDSDGVKEFVEASKDERRAAMPPLDDEDGQRLIDRLSQPIDADTFEEMAGGSAESHLVDNGDGTYSFTPERQQQHREWIEMYLRTTQAGDPVTPSDDPTYKIMGGGPAAGKSVMQKQTPDLIGNMAVLNADEFKDDIPEYHSTNADKAAAFTHEESSYLVKAATAEGLDRGLDVVLDGTGDSSLNSMLKKIKQARDRGYKVKGYYATIETDEAWRRAQERGERTGRHVPENIVRNTHKEVSVVVPDLVPHLDDFTLIYTEGGGIVVATKGPDGDILPVDPDLYEKFLDKAKE